MLRRSQCRSVVQRVHGVGQRWMSSSSSSVTSNDAEDPLLKSLDEENGVLTLTLNRPEQRNALTSSLLDSMLETLVEVSGSLSDVRAIVLQSEGKLFCSGHDLKEIRSMNPSQHEDMFAKSNEMMQLLSKIPQPTIAAVQGGLATAAGCQLVCATDIVVASPMSSFAAPGIKLGLFCHTPGVELVRCVGQKIAMDMLLTGRTLTSEEALNYGLVSRIAGNPRKEAKLIATELAAMSPSAMALGKRTFYDQSEVGNKEEAYKIAGSAMVQNLTLEDTTKGIDFFLQKNKGKKSSTDEERPKFAQWQEFGRQETI